LTAATDAMDILYLLIPLSAALVLLIIGVFGWALHRGQFDDLEREGERILSDGGGAIDDDQSRPLPRPQEFPTN
jgi:cbb3-type cytochrome oxidase maturation protein